jgi:hypothetical protein
MRLDLDFSEFIALLLDHELALLVVGGYAVATHGHHAIQATLTCGSSSIERTLRD